MNVLAWGRARKTSATDLSFSPSATLQKQLHSSLCAYFCALKTNSDLTKKAYASCRSYFVRVCWKMSAQINQNDLLFNEEEQ